MPTLIRLLFVIGVVAGLIYAGMIALVTFVHPEQHEISQTIQLPRLTK